MTSTGSRPPGFGGLLLIVLATLSAALVVTTQLATDIAGDNGAVSTIGCAALVTLIFAALTRAVLKPGRVAWAALALVALPPLALGALDGFEWTVHNSGWSGSRTVGDLTEFELRHGIGPVTAPMTLAPLDSALAAQGQAIFRTKCQVCHKLNERLVGPALQGVTQRRTPEYIMNMILNPAEMVQRHPDARALLAQHLTIMTNQNVGLQDARALLEYLRLADSLYAVR